MTASKDNYDGRRRIGDLLLDPAQRLLWRGSDKIRLPKLSYELLMSLVRHAPGIVGTDQLLTEVWGDVVVSEETVTQRISLLRQALGDNRNKPRYIESIRGVGYRLVAPVTEASETEERRAAVKPLIIAAMFMLALGIGIWAFIGFRDVVERPDNGTTWSVAVLPFADMSAEANQAYFSDGIHEEVITQLSKIDRFAVTSRTSVLPYRHARVNIREIADDLGVNLVIEGSVRHSSNRVRITVQLIDAIQDEHLWSENYDRPLSVSELFEIQSDVAEKIAAALETELSSEEIASLQQLPTVNLEAYDNYLLGRYHLWRGNADDLRRSIEFFEAAVAADPNFAAAYAGLGQALTFVGTSYGWMVPSEAFQLANENVSDALRLQADLGTALSLRGDILTWFEWHWTAAEQTYREASKYSAAGSLGYMLLLSVLSRHQEALELTEEVIVRYPRDHWVRSNAAWRFLSAGSLQRAIAEADVAIGIDAGYGDAFASRGWANLALGNTEQAIADFRRHVEIQRRSPASLAGLAIAQARAGRRDLAENILGEIQQLSAERFVPPEEIARIHVELGNTDLAFEFLQQGYEARSRGLIFLNANQSWDPVRKDPRFRELLRKMDLEID